MKLPAALFQAQSLHLQGQTAAAMQAYQALGPECQQAAVYWLLLALLAEQGGYPDQAFDCLEMACQRPAPQLQTELIEGLWPALLKLLLSLPLEQPAVQVALSWCQQLPWPEAQRLLLWQALLQLALLKAEPLQPLLGDFGRQLQHFPQWLAGWEWLVKQWSALGELQQAMRCAQQGLALSPSLAALGRLLGHICQQRGQWQQALEHYLTVLSQLPEDAESHYYQARLLLGLLEPEKAAVHFQQANRFAPGRPLWQVQAAMAYPPVFSDPAQAEVTLASLLRQAQALKGHFSPEQLLPELFKSGLEPCFHLHYLSEQDLPVRQAFADIFRLPELPPWPPLVAEPELGQLRHFQLGVLVTPGHEGLFLFGNRQLLEALQAAGLRVSLYLWGPSLEKLGAWAQQAHIRLVVLPFELAQAVAQVRQDRLDWMYYWECGTDAINYFLPYFQLARVQFTSWGSVGSTGHPRMQFFLSAEGLNGPCPAYREQLISLPVLPFLFSPDMIAPPPLTRAELLQALGLPAELAEQLLLGCLHNPLKNDFGWLTALQAIVAQLPEARVLMLESAHPVWTAALKQRVTASLGPQAAQLIWLPRQSPDRFLALVQHLDLHLDPFPFGSGKLAFEALGLGTPMLTLPGQQLRGRIVATAYQQMGLSELIASSPAEYISLAVSMGRDPTRRAAFSQQLRAHQQQLMQPPELVPSLLRALLQMLQTVK